MKRGLLFTVALLVCACIGASPAYPSAPDSIVGSYLKGILFLSDGEYESALCHLQKVRKIDPQSGYLRLKLAFTFLKLGREQEAEEEFKQAKMLEDNNLEASVALILLYASQKKEQELEQEYQYFLEQAHHLRPENIKISEYLGQFYFYKKMPEQAIKIYETIVDQRPEYSDGFFWLGYFYEESGNRKKAVRMWQKTIKLNPSHANALNSLGYVYAEEKRNLDQAETMIKKALAEDPDNGAYLDSLGWVYFAKKEYLKAEEYLLQAIEHLQEAVVYEHAGDLYQAMGKKEKALFYYRQGLTLDPESESLQQKVQAYGQKNSQTEENSQ